MLGKLPPVQHTLASPTINNGSGQIAAQMIRPNQASLPGLEGVISGAPQSVFTAMLSAPPSSMPLSPEPIGVSYDAMPTQLRSWHDNTK
jgi:hypothetical protein